MQAPHSLDQYRTILTRSASLGSVVIGRIEPDPLGSWLGRVNKLGRGEDWPLFEGRPMVGIAQLNVSQAPFVPMELDGIGFLTLFLGEEGGDLIVPDERPNGDGWLLRAYPSQTELIDVAPVELQGLRPRRLSWELISDLPDWEDIAMTADGTAINALLDSRDYYEAIGGASQGTKLGGWPDLIQGAISWRSATNGACPTAYALQVDSDEKVGLNLWDSGVIHFGLSVEEGRVVWAAESQFM